MQRYFVDTFNEGCFYISAEDKHHIVKVMRYTIGDHIICVTDGKAAICSIEEITSEQVVARIVRWEEETVEMPIQVTIASGLPKGDKLEWIIQKGTELGASQFIPFSATRSIVKWDEKKGERKVDRWQKIAKEAAEQSHRQIVPKVHLPVNIKTLIEMSKGFDYKLIAFEEDAKRGEASILRTTLSAATKGQSLLFVFGPEGGLSEFEVSLLKAEGFLTCGLGPRILRTETAPLYALAAVSYETELLR